MRITIKDLQILVNRLNIVTGSPVEYGNNHFHTDCYNGGYRLCRVCETGSGEYDISPRVGARELYDIIQGILKGLEIAFPIKDQMDISDTVYTRKQYLNKECNYEAFYAQFITYETKQGAKNIAKFISQEFDKIDSHLNQYKGLDHWDYLAANVRIPMSIYNAAYEKTDNFVWVSDKLCILKNAVRFAMLEMGYVESEEYRNGFTEKFLTKEAK